MPARHLLSFADVAIVLCCARSERGVHHQPGAHLRTAHRLAQRGRQHPGLVGQVVAVAFVLGAMVVESLATVLTGLELSGGAYPAGSPPSAAPAARP
ncbi:MAG: hypothetical protein M0Z42_01880 [Actinomycetota bacterium]|nr:hypothetical protein [Actinomycetota bacterium]